MGADGVVDIPIVPGVPLWGWSEFSEHDNVIGVEFQTYPVGLKPIGAGAGADAELFQTSPRGVEAATW